MKPTTDRVRWAPPGSIALPHPQELGVAYLEEKEREGRGVRYLALAYRGAATRSDFYESFRTREERDARVADWFNVLTDLAAQKAARRAADSQPHTLEIGDILVYTWGYDQTNVDYFQVVGRTAHTIDMRPIAGRDVGGEGISPMATYLLPVKDAFLENGQVIRKRVGGNNYVPMKHGCARKHDGRKDYNSWYA